VSTEIVAEKPAEVLAKHFWGSSFRANPEYEFVLLDRLPTHEQELLGALRGDANFFGLLRPRSATGLTTKAVCCETAMLFQFLQQPGLLPGSVRVGSESEGTIRRLVLDGILQIAHGSEWVCGPAACDADLPFSEENGRILARLSLQAIKHAACLERADSTDLSDQLYRFNTLPLTPQWLQRIPDGTALEEFLQIQVGGRCRSELDQDWTRVARHAERDMWMAWDSRTIPAQRVGDVGYKLYLSPAPAHVKDALRILIPAITAAGAHHFKMGSNVRGLLRPDKMVAYFGEKAALEEAAYRIAKELSGCPSQGVPFTVELDSGALISWASDPPSETAAPVWLRKQSWRQWICNRLASALMIAKREKSAAMPAWRFALERLRLEGVDVVTWAPASTPWQPNLTSKVALS
jgi:hypothetical protein